MRARSRGLLMPAPSRFAIPPDREPKRQESGILRAARRSWTMQATIMAVMFGVAFLLITPPGIAAEGVKAAAAKRGVKAAAAKKRVVRVRLAPVPTDADSLRLAIEDLTASFPQTYVRGGEFLARLASIEEQLRRGPTQAKESLERLKEESLLANPLLDFERLIVLKRKQGQLGLPTNHQCNTSLPQRGYENEIVALWAGSAWKRSAIALPPGRRSVCRRDGFGFRCPASAV